MDVKKKIFELFEKLESAERIEVINELELLIRTSSSAITELNDKHQRFCRENIEKEVWTEGSGQDVVVWCRIILANNTSFKASGRNKKIAAERAAILALKDFDKLTLDEINLQRPKRIKPRNKDFEI